MNQELKQRARKEFDERFVKKPVDWRENHGWEVPYVNSRADNLKSFIDSIIDETVQMTEERIVGVIEDYRKTEWLNLHDRKKYKEQIEMRDTIDKIISLITNNSDINK